MKFRTGVLFSNPKRLIRVLVLAVALVAIAADIYIRVDVSSLRKFLPKSRAVASPPATAPAKPTIHEVDLTFTKRSPLSKPLELAARMQLPYGALGPDYDLSQRPFKAYIPDTNPTAPYGILVISGTRTAIQFQPPGNLCLKNRI